MPAWVKGADELIAKLRTLRTRDANAAVRKGTRTGAKIVARRAEALAPKRTGEMARNIKVRSMPRSKLWIGTMVRAALFAGKFFYGAFQELGWRLGPRKLGDARKKVEGKHYMKRAAEQAGQEATEAAIAAAWAEIERRVAK